MDKEIWKDIAGYEGIYQVSNISSVCNGKRNNAGGYIWRYVND